MSNITAKELINLLNIEDIDPSNIYKLNKKDIDLPSELQSFINYVTKTKLITASDKLIKELTIYKDSIIEKLKSNIDKIGKVVEIQDEQTNEECDSYGRYTYLKIYHFTEHDIYLGCRYTYNSYDDNTYQDWDEYQLENKPRFVLK